MLFGEFGEVNHAGCAPLDFGRHQQRFDAVRKADDINQGVALPVVEIVCIGGYLSPVWMSDIRRRRIAKRGCPFFEKYLTSVVAGIEERVEKPQRLVTAIDAPRRIPE